MDITPTTLPPEGPSPSGYFIWEPDGKRIAVHLRDEAVDQINAAVMRGFAAIRKRGVEVGGLLLGSVEAGPKTVVHIEEFCEIPCSHLYGPSYVLGEDELLALDEKLAEYAPASSTALRVVGFVRSHTREPIALAEPDLALLAARFPDEHAICLLVKPFATRPSEAVFFTRQDGVFPNEAGQEPLVFSRRAMNLPPAPRRDHGPAAEPLELDVARISRRRVRRDPLPAAEGEEKVTAVAGAVPSGLVPSGLGPDVWGDYQHSPDRRSPDRYGDSTLPPTSASAPEIEIPEARTDAIEAPPKRFRWDWVALSLGLLLVGAVIGMALTLTIRPTATQVRNHDPYQLGLRVARAGESFQLKWNPQIPALRQTRSGELRIEDETGSRVQELSVEDLGRGGILYLGASTPLRFRLTLFLQNQTEFSETVDAGAGVQAEAR